MTLSPRHQVASLCASVAGVLCLALTLADDAPARPNVVVIVVDTLRADAVEMDTDRSRTPRIAELAEAGVHFPNAFAHAPMTLPSHAALFSARHPFEAGVLNNGDPIPAGLPLLAEALRDAGYATSAVVSLATLWPLGDGVGLDRGFEHFDVGALEVAPAEDSTRRLDEALDALDEGEPFFLFAHLSDPHEPYNEHAPYFDGAQAARSAEAWLDGERLASPTTSSEGNWEVELELEAGEHEFALRADQPFKLRALELDGERVELDAGALLEPSTHIAARFRRDAPGTVRLRAWLCDVPSHDEIRARYASEVAAADAAIGLLVDGLRERGLWENTLVVLTSDHGEALGERGMVGHVVHLYDELLHVPLVVRLPGDAKDERLARTAEGLVRHVDVTPTILEHLDLPGLPGTSGRSLFEDVERRLIAETHPPEAPRHLFAVRDADRKLILDAGSGRFESYALATDPGELADLEPAGERTLGGVDDLPVGGTAPDLWKALLLELASDLGPARERDEALQRRLSALGY